MKIIYNHLPAKRFRCIATIGVFDGIHRGHQYIFERVKKEAHKLKQPSLVITFDIPPEKILSLHYPGYITHIQDKNMLIWALGIDMIWILKTSPFLLSLTGKEFIHYIWKYFHINTIVVGEDFRFGKKAKSDIDALKKYTNSLGIKVIILKKKKKHKEIISSTLIKQLIRRAAFKKAAEFLGRPYIITGRIIKGEGRGKSLGFPTANIDSFEYVLPQPGVYASSVKVGRRKYLAAVYRGSKPTVTNTRKLVLEAHLIHFGQKKDIVGKSITIEFLERMRRDRKFADFNKLKAAIEADILSIKRKYPRL